MAASATAPSLREMLEGILAPWAIASHIGLQLQLEQNGGIPLTVLTRLLSKQLLGVTEAAVASTLEKSIFAEVDLATSLVHPRGLLEMLVLQIEFYLNPTNAAKDPFLRSQMLPDGSVPVAVMSQFRRIVFLCNNKPPNVVVLTACLQAKSTNLIVDATACTVKWSPRKPTVVTVAPKKKVAMTVLAESVKPPPPALLISKGIATISAAGFTVMTWNILAQFLVGDHGYCPAEFLKWGYRSQLIKDAITKLQPQVLCLQELQSTSVVGNRANSSEDLGGWLMSKGYSMEYLRKQSTNGFQKEGNQLGVALCWRNDVFTQSSLPVQREVVIPAELLQACASKESEDHFTHNSHVMLVHPLVHTVTRKTVIFATTHLISDPRCPEVKFAQSQVVMNQLTTAASVVLVAPPADNQSSFANIDQVPIVLVGDFNSLPESAVYQFIANGAVPTSHPDLRTHDLMADNIMLPVVCNQEVGGDSISHTLNMVSAYANANTKEPSLTTAKPDFQGTLDYIWFSARALHCKQVLELPRPSLVTAENGGIPSKHWPSDHLPLMASFSFC